LTFLGSDGTLCDPDGELFIKPCVQQEIDFYEAAHKDHPRFAQLMPVYIGNLILNDVTTVHDIDEQLPAAAEHISLEMKEEALRFAKEATAEAAKQAEESKDNIRWKPNKNRKIATNLSVVLENAAYGYKRPNILDAKLGRRLWADDAPLEKRQRFDEISRKTTNGSHGFRIAGMRVYKGSEDPSEWDAEDYKVYDKDFGRIHVTPDNVTEEMRRFLFNPQAGIDEHLAKVVAGAFVEDLKRVEDVLANEESRMYSASLLFTYEGDGDALRAAIEEMNPNKHVSGQEKEMTKIVPGLSPGLRVDSGIELNDDLEFVNGSKAELFTNGNGLEALLDGSDQQAILSAMGDNVKVFEIGANGTTTEFEQLEEGSEMSSIPRIYSLKLIDFAHAQFVPGQGPDENSLLGVRSLIKIFEELSE